MCVLWTPRRRFAAVVLWRLHVCDFLGRPVRQAIVGSGCACGGSLRTGGGSVARRGHYQMVK